MVQGPKACIDSDALVNLLALGCFPDALTCLGLDETSCFRLPSVGHQLERGKWVGERWPKADRSAMAAVANTLPILPPPENISIQETLNSVDGIDPGEAYLLARALEETDLLVLTGDGRMVRALHQSLEAEVVQQFKGRILLFPQMVGALANHLSITEVESRWRTAAPVETRHRQKSLSVMFGSSSPTHPDEFWKGYHFQMSNVTDVCGEDWLYSIPR